MAGRVRVLLEVCLDLVGLAEVSQPTADPGCSLGDYHEWAAVSELLEEVQSLLVRVSPMPLFPSETGGEAGHA